jgi:outer membrane autotransporter protein
VIPVETLPPPQPLFATAARTPNQMAVLMAVQNMPSGSAPFVVLANLQNDAQLRDAADQLSGEIYASGQSTYLENSRFVRDAVTTRLAQANLDAYGIGAASNQQAKTQSNGVTWWGQSVGSWGHQDGSSNYATSSRTTGGVLAGADVLVGESSRIGVVGGYTKTALGVAQRGSSLSSDDVYVGLYAGTSLDALTLSAGGDYTRHGITANRRVATADFVDSARGSTAARTAEFYGNAAYRFSFRRGIVEPFAQVAYVKLATDSFRERDSLMALAVQGTRHAVTYTTLGTRAATHFVFQGDSFTAHASLGWRHVAGDLKTGTALSFADANAFAVQGLPIARDALAVNAGIDVTVNKRVKLGISYDAQIAAHAVDAGVRGQVSWRF